MASKGKKLSVAAEIFGQEIDGIIRKVPLDQIRPSDDQPRKERDINIDSLANSLRSEGLLQPIVVTKDGSGYRIIAGERRYRAARSLGWTDLECRILSSNPKDKFRLAVIENLQRENFQGLEEAEAYHRLKSEYGYTDEQLAGIVGKSRNYVSEILSIADMDPEWQDRARSAGISNKNLLIQLAQAVKAGEGDSFLENVQSGSIRSVRTAKEFVKSAKSPRQNPGIHKLPEALPSITINTADRTIHIELELPPGVTPPDTVRLQQHIQRFFQR